MRFLLLTFLLVALTTQLIYGHSSEESQSSEESHERKCIENEVIGCGNEEVHCGKAPVLTKCKYRCICAPGYARTYQGHCVKAKECSPNNRVRRETDCADPNEVYLYCGSACPARCGDKPGERSCTTNCVKGCFCKKGLVLNKNNKCVKPESC